MHKKSVRWTAALCAAGLMLAGCGPVAGDSGTEKIRLMVWSPSEDQSKDSGQWLQTCCENFAALHPEWDITFVYGVADEASAAGGGGGSCTLYTMPRGRHIPVHRTARTGSAWPMEKPPLAGSSRKPPLPLRRRPARP